MNKTTWIVLVIIIVLGIIGAYWYEREPVPSQGIGQTATSSAGIANPASVNCVNLGGQLEISQDSTGGAVGYCHLKDGRVCEEWALFRDGTCTAKK